MYDRYVSVFDIHSGECLQKFVADKFQILGVNFGNSPTRFITKSKSISIWDWSDGKANLVNKVAIDNHSNEFHVMKDGRILVFMFNDALLLDENGDTLTRFEFAREYKTPIAVDENNGRLYRGRRFQVIEEWDFETGRCLATHVAKIAKPNVVPPTEIARQHEVIQTYMWSTEFGNFVPQGDGPRGWATPIRLSSDGSRIVLPGKSQAILLKIPENEVLAKCDFHGKLRASACSNSRMILLNSKGKFFGNGM